ncbi:histone-fold-containing protein [Ramicandelaber brevisporus]|nr:histone-fold-containing protein [Ramicandelaber brevisporus]
MDSAANIVPTTDLEFPLARVRKIMKADPEVNIISQDASFLIARAAELFVGALGRQAARQTAMAKRRTLQHKDVAKAVAQINQLEFLASVIVPLEQDDAKTTKRSRIMKALEKEQYIDIDADVDDTAADKQNDVAAANADAADTDAAHAVDNAVDDDGGTNNLDGDTN